MKVNNRILKCVSIIIFLLNVSSFVNTQGGLDISAVSDIIEDITEAQQIVNAVSDIGKAGVDETLTGASSDIQERTLTVTPVNGTSLSTSTSSSSNETTDTNPASTEKSSGSTGEPELSSTTTDAEVKPTTPKGTTVTEDSDSPSTEASTIASTASTPTPTPSTPSTSSTTSLGTTTKQSNPEEAKVKPWAIATITILISFAMIFTLLYFLRGYLIKKRRMDQRRLLGSRVSQEGFFFGESNSDGFREL